jgi:hypothetical protein
LQKSVHAGIFLGGPQALQTTRYAHNASRIQIIRPKRMRGEHSNGGMMDRFEQIFQKS